MSVKVGIYLDSNAGAPLKPAALEALQLLFQKEGSFVPNPSSIHSHGRMAKKALALARERIAGSLGKQIDPEQLVLTSSGSEANQWVIRSVIEARLSKNQSFHWITTPVEHDSIRQMIDWVKKQGGRVSLLPVDSEGAPDIHFLSSLLEADTALVSLIWVNNETGVMTDVSQLAKLTQSKGIPLHLDAAQAWGKFPLHLESLGAQFVCFSGHKIGALAGTGVVWLARGCPALPTILGKQEKGRRGGTENTAGLVSLGAAASTLDPLGWAQRLEPLRDRLQQRICERIPGALVNGGGAPRVANTLNLSFEGVEGDGLVMALDLAGYSVSAGSACASGVLEPSHILMAMGRTKAQAMAAIRISLPDEISWEQLESFVNDLENVVLRMKSAAAAKQID